MILYIILINHLFYIFMEFFIKYCLLKQELSKVEPYMKPRFWIVLKNIGVWIFFFTNFTSQDASWGPPSDPEIKLYKVTWGSQKTNGDRQKNNFKNEGKSPCRYIVEQLSIDAATTKLEIRLGGEWTIGGEFSIIWTLKKRPWGWILN